MQEIIKRSHLRLLILLVSFYLFFGCGTVPDDEAKKTGSIIKITSINGFYNDEEGVNTVDVNQDICDVDPDTGDITIEDFFDHFAVVSLSNRPLPNADDQTASTVYIIEYDIDYERQSDNTPELDSRHRIPVTDSFAVPPCLPGSTCADSTLTVELVPIGLKADLNTLYVASGQVQFTYNVHYTFYGENEFGKEYELRASTIIYVANYDYCEN